VVKKSNIHGCKDLEKRGKLTFREEDRRFCGSKGPLPKNGRGVAKRWERGSNHPRKLEGGITGVTFSNIGENVRASVNDEKRRSGKRGN